MNYISNQFSGGRSSSLYVKIAELVDQGKKDRGQRKKQRKQGGKEGIRNGGGG